MEIEFLARYVMNNALFFVTEYHYVAWLWTLRDLLASASRVLRLNACIITPSSMTIILITFPQWKNNIFPSQFCPFLPRPLGIWPGNFSHGMAFLLDRGDGGTAASGRHPLLLLDAGFMKMSGGYTQRPCSCSATSPLRPKCQSDKNRKISSLHVWLEVEFFICFSGAQPLYHFGLNFPFVGCKSGAGD